MPECPQQHDPVRIIEVTFEGPHKEVAFHLLVLVQQQARQKRNDGDGDKQRGNHGQHHRHRQTADEFTRTFGQKSQG